MSGSTLATFHGHSFGDSPPAIGCVVDGCPPGLALSRGHPPDLDAAAGTSRHVTQRREEIGAIRSGFFEEKPRTPIGLHPQRDAEARIIPRSKISSTRSPTILLQKYGIRDYAAAAASRA